MPPSHDLALSAQEAERLTDVCRRIESLTTDGRPLAEVVRELLRIDNDYLLPALSDLALRAGV